MTAASTRNVLPDEMDLFLQRDKVQSLDYLIEKLDKSEVKFELSTPVCHFHTNNQLFIVSSNYVSGISQFLLKIFEDLSFEGFHYGVRQTIKPLSANRVTK